MSTSTSEPSIFVILGATGAVGSDLARRLSARGDRVVLAARASEQLDALADEVAGVPMECDGSDFDQVEDVFREAARLPGVIKGAVNCAGSILLKPAHLTSRQHYEDTLGSNLTTAFATVRSAARAMRKQGGSIVLVSSAAATIGLANHEAIAAAKAGVEGLMRASAATYASSGIRVNTVAPGLVESSMSKKITSNHGALAASLQLHPLARVGQPEEVATVISWLLGPDTPWVTGQVWGIDGGLGTLKTLPVQRARPQVTPRTSTASSAHI